MENFAEILAQSLLECRHTFGFSENSSESPRVFVQFGPGFDITGLLDSTDIKKIALNKLSGFPLHPTPDGFTPHLIVGKCRNVPVMAVVGHHHIGEGKGLLPCVLPTALAWKLGARHHIFVDSGISLCNELKTGRWMILADYINGYAFSPTDGCHQLLKTAYTDMTETFSQRQNSELINSLANTGIIPRIGTYMARPGFHTATTAETIIAQKNGAKMIGHDLVLESMFSHALGATVSAFALATAQWQPNNFQPYSRQEALEICNMCSRDFIRGIAKGIEAITQTSAEKTTLPESQADEILSKPIIAPENRCSPLRAFLPHDEN